MRNSPLVTVIVPAYNHERYVAQSIRSVIAQDYEHLELVVLNDGSTDRTAEVIRSLDAECRARFERYEFIDKANEGVARTANRGLAWSRGDFITGIASDDLMKSCKVSALMDALADAPADVGLACGDADFIDADGNAIDLDNSGNAVQPGAGIASFIGWHIRKRTDIDPATNFFAYDTLIRGNYIPSMAMVWRKAALERVGAWTPGNAIDDWDLWLRLARRYRCIHVPCVVASYRWHAYNSHKTTRLAIRRSMDLIYEREFACLRTDPALARFVARMWLKNCRALARSGERRYLRRYLRHDVLLAAMGFAPLGMPHPAPLNQRFPE